jgi:hypothetical protein
MFSYEGKLQVSECIDAGAFLVHTSLRAVLLQRASRLERTDGHNFLTHAQYEHVEDEDSLIHDERIPCLAYLERVRVHEEIAAFSGDPQLLRAHSSLICPTGSSPRTWQTDQPYPRRTPQFHQIVIALIGDQQACYLHNITSAFHRARIITDWNSAERTLAAGVDRETVVNVRYWTFDRRQIIWQHSQTGCESFQ